MSLFYSTPQAEKSKRGEVTSHQLAFIVLVVLTIAIERKMAAVTGSYYRNIEILYGGLYTLFAGLLALAAWRYARTSKAVAGRYRFLRPFLNRRSGIAVGLTKDHEVLFLPDEIRTSHVQIIGATGRGKSMSVVAPWLIRDVLRGRSAVLVDGKGDWTLVPKLRSIIERAGVNAELFLFDMMTPGSSCTTNPLAFGTAQQITDRIFTAFRFEDAYYRGVQYELCSAAISLIHADGREVTFRGLYEFLTNEGHAAKTNTTSANAAHVEKLKRYFRLPEMERQKLMSGVTSQLGPFAHGEISASVNGPVEARPHCTLSQALTADDGIQRVLVLILRFLEEARKTRHYAAYKLALECGLRVGEIVGLSKQDVDLKRCQLHIHRQWVDHLKCYGPTKGRKERFIGFDPRSGLKEALAEAILASAHPEAIFVTQAGNRVRSRKLAGRYFTTLLKRSRVPKIRFHDLRHTFASWYMIENDDIWSLKAILGHSDVQTTQRYAHLSGKHQRVPSFSWNRASDSVQKNFSRFIHAPN